MNANMAHTQIARLAPGTQGMPDWYHRSCCLLLAGLWIRVIENGSLVKGNTPDENT